MTREAVICEPLRTPVGRFGGALRDVGAAALCIGGGQALSAIFERVDGGHGA